MSWILILKNDPAEIGRMLAEEQRKRQEQQAQDSQRIEQEYAPHFEELKRLVAEKKAQADALEAQSKPTMTPQIQQRYQKPLDEKNEKQEFARQIRLNVKQGRKNSPDNRKMIDDFYNKYGHYPLGVSVKRMPKKERVVSFDDDVEDQQFGWGDEEDQQFGWGDD